MSGVHESQDEGGVPQLHCAVDPACEATVNQSTGGRFCRSWGPWDEPAAAKHAATAADADAATAARADEDDARRWTAANDAGWWDVHATATAAEDDDATATAAENADDAAAATAAADDGWASATPHVCRWWAT